ncbi:hypothetical protein A2630_00445 [Candidatus Woesebacteria bacterium RIFCSPHIGHO2_01_FULL_44_10]|uniref:Large ribosomal subunit protein bL25 n=1 Tax=Candidatus Woesebacteria bacterium RIFCSPLOWO2_01_FULL_44_14 TaxID=1802525 RepID=A0A1F8C2K6_9BACT|nr:MAG: hypothetical protein A2630_00445 [Candidatus Woesebacteria bacterium RIFCSPHIGHO2_01_FULL_44_10]OGM53722.1 MAG: hypothetical protein A3F62_03600 [Candidatus Woesebacteria bacterium RIFCSPHIGHO2_12_FULL_44_11]OGM70069.1 MAG: hypothetical protein A2975_03265 [Candidatus Woesebacteria bacterium RIFCSPLOWO2_01_FULL_44_14]
MKKYKLTAQARKLTGRKVKTLRRGGLLPSNVYGVKVKSQTITVKKDEFKKVYDEAGETSVVELSVGTLVKPVLISNIQVDPVTGETLHVDFRQVDLTKKVTATVPVELIGESPAESQALGTVVHQLTEIDVEALPTDLPDKFEVDISGLVEVDQAILVKDLKYDREKVKLEAGEDQIVAKVEPPQKEEEVAPPPVAEEAPVEGEAPAAEPAPEAPEVKEN